MEALKAIMEALSWNCEAAMRLMESKNIESAKFTTDNIQEFVIKIEEFKKTLK